LNIQDLNIQDWQKQFRGYARPLAKVVLTVFLGMLVFELVQNLLWPDQSLWQSHAAEVIYAATLASVVGYFALRMHAVLHQQVLEENEKYKKSEEELRRNKEWFRSLIEHGSDLITVIDPKGTILYDSPSIERILGYRPIDRQGKSGLDLVHPEDIPRAQNTISLAFQKLGSTHTVEMRMRGQDGRWHVFESTGKVILDHDGKLRGVINSRDITERKQMTETLLQAEKLYLMLLSSTAEGIYGIDTEGRCTFINKAAAAMVGHEPEDCSGKNMHLLIHHSRRDGSPYPVEECPIFNAFKTGRGSRVEEDVLWRRDGTSFDAAYSAFPIVEEGVIHGAVITFSEITERKQMQAKQLARLARLATLGQLIGGIVHELKNPLFILTGHIQMAREKLAHQEYADVGSGLEIIDEVGRRMKTITDRFLTIAKPGPPLQEQCSIQTVLHGVLEFLANELMKNNITVATDFAPDLPKIRSDPWQLHEVFLNLVLNAIQAMAKAHGKGILTVTTRLADGWIEVRVQDDGPNITPEHRARLFEPFFTTKRREQGTGLGLWIVRSTLMTLKGEVSYESEVGKGSTFIVRLPINAEESTR
jgi:PAS domain S-box-containing protein